MDSIDGRIARIAARQHGVVALEQCVAAGMSADAVRRRVRKEQWRRIHRGVYVVGAAPLSDVGRYLAAVLACGDGAVLSHRSAASLWGLQPHHRTASHVTALRVLRPQKGIHIHWTRRLEPRERALRRGVPVTSLARTVLDMAELATDAEFEEVLRAAERIHKVERTALRPIPGRRGNARLQRSHVLTRGDLERLFLAFCDELGFVRPEMNVPFGPYDLDAVWWEAGLVVEIDDYDTHLNRNAFDADRARDRTVAVAGLRPVRITFTDLTARRARLAAELDALGAPRSG